MRFGYLMLLALWLPQVCVAAEVPVVTPKVERSSKSVVKVQGREETQKLAAQDKAVEVDEVWLWDAFHRGDYAAVRARIADYRRQQPDWRPPEELLRLLADAEVDQAVELFRSGGKAEALIRMHARYPERFDCSHQYRRLALADAWQQRGAMDRAERVYRTIHHQCKGYLRIEALEHAAEQLPEARFAALLKLADSKGWSAEQRQRLAALKLRHLMHQASKSADRQVLLAQADALAAELVRLKSAPLARSLAWLNLEQKRPERALDLFAKSRQWQDSDEAIKGEILALHELKRFGEMRSRIEASHDRLKAAGVLVEVLPLLAGSCGEARDYACQLGALEELAGLRPLNDGEQRGRAWALFQTQRYREAADAFEALYRQAHDEDSGKGLYFSLQKAGDVDRLQALARELDGVLEQQSGSDTARMDFERKLFLMARAADASYHPALRHADSDFVRAGFMRRVQSSTTAVPLLSTFELRKFTLAGTHVFSDVNRLGVHVDRTLINAGDPLLRANDVGFKLPGPYAFAIQSHLQGYEWDVQFRHEGWTSYDASIGQGFVGGPIAATFKARLGTDRIYDHGQVRLEAYRQPLRDRIFAYVGLTEPTTGQHWGRVSRNGAELTGYHGFGDTRWGVSYQAGFEWLEGVNVQSNRHYQVALTVPYGFEIGDVIQLSAGPYLHWQRYANNQNHFTFGHGGYFSPQRDTTVGLNVHAETREGLRLHARFDGIIGRRSHDQAAAPIFPLAPNGLLYPASHIRETVYSLRLATVLRISDHLQLGADVSYWKSSQTLLNQKTQVNDLTWMAYLTWQFDARQASLSMDHPWRGLSPMY